MGRDSFICGTWLIQMSDMTHLSVSSDFEITTRPTILLYVCVMWLIYMWDMTCSYAWHDSFIRVPWTQDRLAPHKQILCVTWLIHMWDTTHSHACKYSCMCVTWPMYMWDTTYSRAWNYLSIRVTGLIHPRHQLRYTSTMCMCVTHISSKWYHSHIYMRDMTRICVTWLNHCCATILRSPRAPQSNPITYPIPQLCVSHDRHNSCDSFICGTWLIQMSDMTHLSPRPAVKSYNTPQLCVSPDRHNSFIQHDSCICVPWLNHCCAPILKLPHALQSSHHMRYRVAKMHRVPSLAGLFPRKNHKL